MFIMVNIKSMTVMFLMLDFSFKLLLQLECVKYG